MTPADIEPPWEDDEFSAWLPRPRHFTAEALADFAQACRWEDHDPTPAAPEVEMEGADVEVGSAADGEGDVAMAPADAWAAAAADATAAAAAQLAGKEDEVGEDVVKALEGIFADVEVDGQAVEHGREHREGFDWTNQYTSEVLGSRGLPSSPTPYDTVLHGSAAQSSRS
jgi:hypothetical protein